jgi:putative ABC transport system permease protein
LPVVDDGEQQEDILRELLGHLFRHKMRTALTIFGIVVGVFALTMIGSLAEFMNFAIEIQEATALNRINVYPKNWEVSSYNENTVRQIQRVKGVLGTFVATGGLLHEEDENQGIYFAPEQYYGTTSNVPALEFENPFGANVPVWKGRRPVSDSMHETIVGYELAQKYGWQVGQTITVRDREFVVVGIWERVPNVPSNFVQISYDAARQMREYSWYIGTIMAVPEPGADPDEVARRIEDELDGLRAQSPREALQASRQQLTIITLILSASVVLAVLVGGLSTINTMVMSVTERTREIGLKKALGASDWDVVAEFLFEAAVIGALGGAVGILGGWAGSQVINALTLQSEGMTLFLTTPRLVIVSFVFTVLLGMTAGVYPAWRASRLDPVLALRNAPAVQYAARGIRRLVYLIRRQARLILTVLGVAAGIFALTVIGGLSEYINGFLSEVQTGAADRVGVYISEQGGPYSESTARQISRIPGVRGVVLTSGGGPIVEEEEATTGQYPSGSFYGIDTPTGEPGFETPFRLVLRKGRFFEPGSLDEVVVTYDLAESKGLDVGDTLVIRDQPFTVVGIWERLPYGAMTGLSKLAYISRDAARRVLNRELSLHITALVAPGWDPRAVAESIEEEFPWLETETTGEIIEIVNNVLVVFTLILGSTAAIAIIVGSLSVINTMIMSVSERTREIGLKKAVGAEDSDILAEYVQEAGWIGGLGGTVGVILGWVTTLVINYFVQRSEGLDIMSVTPRLAVGAVVFATFLGMLAGVYPAWRASRLDPVQALRTE